MDLFKTWLVERYIAHRGLHNETFPENSLGAFENAIKNGYPIELDVHLLSDGNVVVFHDDTLSRMTGKDGYIKSLTVNDLKNYNLNNTQYTIPTFKEVLDLVNGKVPILIEIKNKGKVGELESAVLKLLKEYNGEYAVQSFNPFVVEWFYKNAPEIPRGQLSGYFKDEEGKSLGFIKRFALKRIMLHKKSKPQFIAYEAQTVPNRFVKKFKKLPLLVWTVTSQEEYMRLVKYVDNIIFQNFEPKI